MEDPTLCEAAHMAVSAPHTHMSLLTLSTSSPASLPAPPSPFSPVFKLTQGIRAHGKGKYDDGYHL